MLTKRIWQNLVSRILVGRLHITSSLIINIAEANEEVDKTAKGTIKTIKYPENITLKNLYQFVLYTPTCVYHINVIKWKPRNYKLIARKIIEAIFVLYSSAFIIYQYIAPEARNVVSYINTEQYLKMLTSMLILVVSKTI